MAAATVGLSWNGMWANVRNQLPVFLTFVLSSFLLFLFLALLVLVSFLLGQGIMSGQLEEISKLIASTGFIA